MPAYSTSQNMSWSKLWEMMKDREAWCAEVHGVTKSWTWLTEQQQREGEHFIVKQAIDMENMAFQERRGEGGMTTGVLHSQEISRNPQATNATRALQQSDQSQWLGGCG